MKSLLGNTIGLILTLQERGSKERVLERNGMFRLENKLKESNSEAKPNQTETSL